MAKVSKETFAKNQAEVMVGTHPERLLILGGAWLVMVTMGVMGVSAIVNPEQRLPIIDPILTAIAQVKQQPTPQDLAKREDTETINLVPTLTTDEDYLQAIPQDSTESTAIAEEVATPDPEATISLETPTVTPTTENGTNANQNNHVPLWIYWAIFLSCTTGSAIITMLLYQLTRPLPSAALKQSQRLPLGKPTHKKSLAKPQATHKRATPKQVISVKQPKVEAIQQVQQQIVQQPIKFSQPPVSTVEIPVMDLPAEEVPLPLVKVPAIAPLNISTPDDVETPTLKIEPVVDPQPVLSPTTSRADYLASLSQRAQQQPPKSLVEKMDIRRRNQLASFS